MPVKKETKSSFESIVGCVDSIKTMSAKSGEWATYLMDGGTPSANAEIGEVDEAEPEYKA